MITSHARLLQQLHEYVDEYIAYIGNQSSQATVQATNDLRWVIHELEDLQKNPAQPHRVERVRESISDQLERLRQFHAAERARKAVRPQHRTLAQLFQEYIQQEIDYLMRGSEGVRREQVNLLLGDVIADLKALALHPTEAQAKQLAADLEKKREQIAKLQRPWQELHP
jgi:CRP-like cAMP-binding protein